MKIFYSNSTGGFYDTEFHGSRMLPILDPTWVRPTIRVPQGDGGTDMVDVPDESAVHPIIEVPNPNCKIPADAVEITAAERADLLEALSQNKCIGVDANGKPVAVDPPQPTPEQIIAGFTAAIQQRLDEFAKTRGYDSILSACTYATSLVPAFKTEGQYCVEARDGTWSSAYTIMAAVQSGQRSMPTLAEVLAELPNLVWPA